MHIRQRPWLVLWTALFVSGAAAVVLFAQPNDGAVFVGQEAPSSVVPGKGFTARVTFRNSGGSDWTKAAGIKLGSQAPQDSTTWGLNRVGLRNRDRVRPGDTKTFEFRGRAPAAPGTYSFEWRLLREGVQWFGANSARIEIRVGSGGAANGGGGDSGGGGGGGGDPGGGDGGGNALPQGSQFKDLVFAGYQGWFATPGDRSLRRWSHWNDDRRPRTGQVSFELYPDVREYAGADLYLSGLNDLRGGGRSRVFSSARQGVLDVHFRWMREYGIDGVALQRFVASIPSRAHRAWRNDVAARLRQSAQKHGRYFYIMYDISGAPEKSWADTIRWDWNQQIGNKLKLTQSGRYARQNGQPVVGIWGLGFKSRPGSKPQARSLIRWFKDRGIYVVGVVPYHWRDSIQDSKAGWQDVYAELDMVVPWSVGGYSSDADLEANYNDFIRPDRDYAASIGVDHQRVIFPGFAWSNWRGGPRNQIPRRGGNLLWRQAYFLREAGLGGYIAMFDEYDEATAIAKAAENASQIPHGQYFLTLDADGRSLPSDHYLWLSGQVTRLLKGEIANDWDMPSR
ncbi:MAG: xylosidase/arabinosidase [Acidobacteriota bacterium]